MSLLHVLASGVDGLELTARGGAQRQVWELLERAKVEAQEAGEPVPFAFGRSLRPFLILPHGRRGWQYWLTSPDFEMGLGRNREGVPAYVQLHSAYLHSLGPEMAAGLVGTLLQVDVMNGPFKLIGSRVDVYADVQGWELALTDMERFASRGRFREAYPLGEAGSSSVYMAGRRVTGFRFGRDTVVARVYDKTAEIARRPGSWVPELWAERDETMPVWRVEFQLRRRAIAEFNVTEFDEVLASAQDFWEHCTKEFLTLRTRTGNRQRARWPVDPTWAEVQAVKIAPTRTGVIRRRVIEGNEEMTVRGLQGYVTSWAATQGYEELGQVLKALGPRLTRYWKGLGRTFRDEVRHKRARLLWLSEESDRAKVEESERPSDDGRSSKHEGSNAGETPQAREGRTLPRIGRSARTARRARVPGGDKPNRSQGGRAGARQRVSGGRDAVGRRGRSMSRRGHGSLPSVSSQGTDGASEP